MEKAWKTALEMAQEKNAQAKTRTTPSEIIICFF
jgi:hypothetical protein